MPRGHADSGCAPPSPFVLLRSRFGCAHCRPPALCGLNDRLPAGGAQSPLTGSLLRWCRCCCRFLRSPTLPLCGCDSRSSSGAHRTLFRHRRALRRGCWRGGWGGAVGGSTNQATDFGDLSVEALTLHFESAQRSLEDIGRKCTGSGHTKSSVYGCGRGRSQSAVHTGLAQTCSDQLWPGVNWRPRTAGALRRMFAHCRGWIISDQSTSETLAHHNVPQ